MRIAWNQPQLAARGPLHGIPRSFAARRAERPQRGCATRDFGSEMASFSHETRVFRAFSARSAARGSCYGNQKSPSRQSRGETAQKARETGENRGKHWKSPFPKWQADRDEAREASTASVAEAGLLGRSLPTLIPPRTPPRRPTCVTDPPISNDEVFHGEPSEENRGFSAPQSISFSLLSLLSLLSSPQCPPRPSRCRPSGRTATARRRRQTEVRFWQRTAVRQEDLQEEEAVVV